MLGAVLVNRKDAEGIPRVLSHLLAGFYRWLLVKASFLLLNWRRRIKKRKTAILEAPGQLEMNPLIKSSKGLLSWERFRRLPLVSLGFFKTESSRGRLFPHELWIL